MAFIDELRAKIEGYEHLAEKARKDTERYEGLISAARCLIEAEQRQMPMLMTPASGTGTYHANGQPSMTQMLYESWIADRVMRFSDLRDGIKSRWLRHMSDVEVGKRLSAILVREMQKGNLIRPERGLYIRVFRDTEDEEVASENPT